MSILLESLSQQPSAPKNSVPDVHVSHFDDEMLGDDWLVSRVKIWRGICILLAVLLISSWVYFYYKLQEKKDTFMREVTTENSQLARPSENLTTGQIAPLKPVEVPAAVNNQAQTATVASQSVTDSDANFQSVPQQDTVDQEAISKQVYRPQKRAVADNPVASESPSTKPESLQQKPEIKQASTEQRITLWHAELSEELKSQFPNIEINSYVVADTPDDSFVILDGSFYKINQVIAPQLILREITSGYILVEFQSQRVKLPLN